jgi:hypothetical protein
MAELERKVTVFTEVELAQALIEAYEVVFKAKPTTRVIVNAWSQCALECGRDGKGNINTCRNYNLGNITITQAQAKEGRDYWALRCKEQLRDKTGKLTGEWKWCDMRFASNPTLREGAIHYWTFFSAAKRKVALDAMHTGGPAEFTAALAAIWYMTADPGHYQKGLTNLAQVASASVFTALATKDPPQTPQPEPLNGSVEAQPPSPPTQPAEQPPEPVTGHLGGLPLLVPEREAASLEPTPQLTISPWTRFVVWLVGLLASVFKKGLPEDGNVSRK